MDDNNLEIYNESHSVFISTFTPNNSLEVDQEPISNELVIDSTFLNIDVLDGSVANQIDILEATNNRIEITDTISFNSVYANNIIGIENYLDNYLDINNYFNDTIVGESGIYVNELNTYTYIGISGIHLDQIENVTASAQEINFLDRTYQEGIAEPNKALVLDDTSSFNLVNNISMTGNLDVGGNLVVSGAAMIINSTQVDFVDNIITINTRGLPAGGFRVYDGSNYQSLLWVETNDRWEFSGSNIYTTGNFIGIIDGGTP